MKRLVAALFALLLLPAVANASVVNASFESGSTGWTVAGTSNFGVEAGYHFYSTDGSYGARIYSKTSCRNSGCGGFSFQVGDYGSISQVVDLTFIGSIVFDAQLDAGGAGAFQPIHQAGFYIDNVLLWSSQTAGAQLDIVIDTSLLTGSHTIEFRNETIGAGVDVQSDWFLFDNIRTVDVPAPTALGLFGFGLAGLGFAKRRRKV